MKIVSICRIGKICSYIVTEEEGGVVYINDDQCGALIITWSGDIDGTFGGLRSRS